MYIQQNTTDWKNMPLKAMSVKPQPSFDDGKEFIVCLQKDVDYNSFWNDMETESNVPNIPNRIVRIINDRSVMKRICHYVLTDEEANNLKNDSRVLSVEIPTEYRSDLVKQVRSIQSNNFSKPVNMLDSMGDLVNYGLARHNSETNNYTYFATPDKYNYTLTGKGVDVVIHDTGLEINHPEFLDSNGNTRVQQIDWYVESGRVVRERVPINLKTSHRMTISANSYINFLNRSNTIGNTSNIFDPSHIPNGLLLGAVNGCAYDFRYGVFQGGRMTQYSYYGGQTTDWHSLGGVQWDVRFYDGKFIEIVIYRHDAALTGEWGMYCNNHVLVDLNGLKHANVQGPNGTTINIVLSTDDEGLTWQVNGGIGHPYHVRLNNNNGHYELTPGYSDNLNWAYGCQPVFQQTIVSTEVAIPNVGQDFLIGDIWKSNQNPDFYSDYGGHGTHVGGIIAGKNYGWAKEANIYLMKVLHLDGETDTGIAGPDYFDLIIEWHNRKPIDPETGYKRPTVVNMSWGYNYNFFPQYGVYRGTPWNYDETPDLRWTTIGFPPQGGGPTARIDSVDISIEEMIDAGIHVCIAAGNEDYKIDVPGGIDYDNICCPAGYSIETTQIHYHRGSSPYSNRAFITGCLTADPTWINEDGKESKAYFSNCGPGVDFYSVGHCVMSATSIANNMFGAGYSPEYYYWNKEGENWLQLNLSGTSMASPQTCGYCAVVLEVNPGATPAQLKQFMVNNCKDQLASTGLDDDFADSASVRGGGTKIMYNKFNSPNSLKINKE